VPVRPFLTHGTDILHHSYADVDQEVELGSFLSVTDSNMTGNAGTTALIKLGASQKPTKIGQTSHAQLRRIVATGDYLKVKVMNRERLDEIAEIEWTHGKGNVAHARSTVHVSL
jgi:hypothetical protein